MADSIGSGTGPHDHSEAGPDGAGTTLAPKVTAGQVFTGHGDFATLQAAIDYAITNDYAEVIVPPGTYDPITVDSNRLSIRGVGQRAVTIDGGTTSHAVTVNGYSVRFSNITATTTAGAGNAYDAWHIAGNLPKLHNCRANGSDRHGYWVDGTRGAIIMAHGNESNIDGSTIYLTANTGNIVVDASNEVSSITNNGTGNVIGDTA